MPSWLMGIILAGACFLARCVLLPEDAGCSMVFWGNQEVQLIKEGDPFDFVLAFTMESWVKAADDYSTFFGGTMGSEMCIHGFASMGAGPRISIFQHDTGPCAGGACPWGTYGFWAPTMPGSADALCYTPVPDTDWHHVAATWDNVTAKLYIDGVEACSETPPSSKIDLYIARNAVLSRHAYSVGALPDHYRFFKGQVDEVRLWDVPRTASEIANGMHLHLDSSLHPNLLVDLRFDECEGEIAANAGHLGSTGDLLHGTVGIRSGSDVGVGSAPAFVQSGALVFGAGGHRRAELHSATGGFSMQLPVRAFDDVTKSVIDAPSLTLQVSDASGGLSVSASASNGTLLVQQSGQANPRIEGAENLAHRRLIDASAFANYTVSHLSQSTLGSLTLKVIGNRKPAVGDPGKSLAFSQGTYAGSLDFVLKHRGTKQQSGASHSAKVTVEFWSKNSVGGLQEAGNAGTAMFTMGNSEGAAEPWSPATCALDGGCHGRGSGHVPWSAGFPWTFWHFGITHLPMSAQLPCKWAHHSGEWQHMAFVADPDTEFHGIYFNGHLCNPNSKVDGPTDDLRSFFLGVWPIARSAADTVHHTGEVDEMRIWRSARTQEELIDGMFRAPTQQEVESGDLLASWSFDDCGTSSSAICKDASGNGNDLIFAVCGRFDDVTWDGFIGPVGPAKAACLNKTYPEEAHSGSWPAGKESNAIVHGPPAAIRPRSLEEDSSRSVKVVIISAMDPDMEDRLEIHFTDVPAAVGELYDSQGNRMSEGSVVQLMPSSLLVHSASFTLRNMPEGKGLTGHIRVKAKDSKGAFSEEVGIEVHAHLANAGQEFVDRLGRVQPCPQGFFSEGTGLLCQKCEAGTYGPLPLSWKETAGNAGCLKCPAGKFGAEHGLQHCTDCSEGRFSTHEASTTCSNCELGFFGNQTGMSECSPCEGGTTTMTAGAVNAASCVCSQGYFLPCEATRNLSLCSVDIQPPAGTCRKCPAELQCSGGYMLCPEGAACPGNLHAQPLLKPGYWNDQENLLDVYNCRSSHACPGQTSFGDPPCKEHHRGLNCGECIEPLYMIQTEDDSECVECLPDSGWLLLPLALVIWLLLGACFFVSWSVRHRRGRQKAQSAAHAAIVPEEIVPEATSTAAQEPQPPAKNPPILQDEIPGAAEEAPTATLSPGASMLTIGVGHLLSLAQKLTIIGAFDYEWPQALKSLMLAIQSMLSLEYGTFRGACITAFGFEGDYLEQVLLPIFVFILAMTWLGVHVATGRRFKFIGKSPILNIMGMCMLSLFVVITSSSFALVECYGNPAGTKTLLRYPAIICGEPRHLIMIPAMVVSVLLYIVGFLAYCIYMLREAPTRFDDPEFRMQVDFLVLRFDPCAFWFGMVTSLRSLLFAASTVIFPEGRLKQFWFLSSLVLASLIVHMAVRPYRFSLANRVETAEHCLILVLLAFGLGFGDEDGDDMLVGMIVMGTIIAYLLTLFIFICSALYMMVFPGCVKSRQEQLTSKTQSDLRLLAALVLSRKEVDQIVMAATPKDLEAIMHVTQLIVLECSGLQQVGLMSQRLPMMGKQLRTAAEGDIQDLRDKSFHSLQQSMAMNAWQQK